MVRPALCCARNFRRPAISALVAGLAMVLQLGVVDVPAAAQARLPDGMSEPAAAAVRPVSVAVPLVPMQGGADGSGDGGGGGGCGADGSPCGSGSDNNDSSAGSSGGTSDRKPDEESNADGSRPKSEPNGGQGSSAPTTESAADGSRQTETAAPVADGAKRTEPPAPVADAAKRTETPAPGADGARTTEPAAPGANGPRPTESAAPVADGARPTETPAPGAPADGARPTPTAAPVADGAKRDEPVAPGDGAKTTPAPAPIDGARPNDTARPVAPADGARPSGAPVAPGIQAPPSPGAVPIAQECEGAENCPNPVTGIPPYEQGTSAACADGSGSKAGCDSSSAGSTALEVGHLILDAASFVPGPVGIAASVINAGAYLAEGKETEAGFAMMGALPGGKFAAGAMRAAKAARPAIGYAEGLGKSALTSDRLQHGTRHLEEAGILPSWSGKKSPKLIEEALTPILERPKATFDDTVGPPTNRQPVKGFVGELKDGSGATKPVAVLVYKEGERQGKLATSYVPTPDQLQKWGVN